jgi:hypothetical protein
MDELNEWMMNVWEDGECVWLLAVCMARGDFLVRGGSARSGDFGLGDMGVDVGTWIHSNVILQ